MPRTIERLKSLMNCEKLKCPKCEKGYISAAGDPKTTNVFKCDKCPTAIVPRYVPLWKGQENDN